MKVKNETDALNDAIIVLQNKRRVELELLKEQFHITVESLKPLNLIKSNLKGASTSPNTKNNIINAVIGIASGFLSRKILVGSTHNPIRKLFGTILQVAITGIVSKHSDGIKSSAENLFHRFLKYRKESQNGIHHDDNL